MQTLTFRQAQNFYKFLNTDFVILSLILTSRYILTKFIILTNLKVLYNLLLIPIISTFLITLIIIVCLTRLIFFSFVID